MHGMTDMKFPSKAVLSVQHPMEMKHFTHLIPPGSTLTSTPTIDSATVKTLVSNTFIEPPLSGVAGFCESLYVNGFGTVPAGSEGATSVVGGAVI